VRKPLSLEGKILRRQENVQKELAQSPVCRELAESKLHHKPTKAECVALFSKYDLRAIYTEAQRRIGMSGFLGFTRIQSVGKPLHS